MARLAAVSTGFVWVAFLSTLGFVACGGGQHTVPAPPTSTSYRLCQLDLHCPGGSYCSAGVCDQDCAQDADCDSEQSCDPRGRCYASGTLPAPPKYAGHLVAPPPTLELSPENPSGEFTLGNDGVEAIGRFHVVSDDPNVSATPSGGTLASGQSVQIQVQVGPRFTGTGATIHVLSTGGRVDVDILWGSTLSGRLQGSVTVAAPFALGSAPFAMEIGGNPAAMTGAIDGTASLLWPFNAAVSAQDDGLTFNATFQFVAAAGQTGNPLFDVPLQRSIVLAGNHQSASVVIGQYTETITGLPGGSVTTTGTFQLQGGATVQGVKPVASPVLGIVPIAPLPSACPCTESSCTGGALAGANWFFAAGFPFEQWSATSSYQDGQCALSSGDTGPCTAPAEISCALGGFAAVPAYDGVVDVWRAQASYALLSGKAILASVLQPIGASFGNGIEANIDTLAAAAASLSLGLHGAPGGGGLLAAANYSVARTTSAAQQFGKVSLRDAPNDPQLDDEQRFGGVVAAALLAAAEEVDRQQRSQALINATIMTTAQQAASGALLDLAALGALLGGQASPISGLASSFAPLAGTFEKLEKNLNAAGYSSDYVPFLYDPSSPNDDLYQQLLTPAQGSLATAQADEAALIAENANVGTAEASMGAQLSGVAQTETNAITALCGALPDPLTSTAGCGLDGGQIGVDQDDRSAAAAALAEAKGRFSADVLKLETLNQQAQQELEDQQDELFEVISTDATIDLINTAKAQQQVVNQGFQCAMGVMSGGMSGSASLSGGGGVSGSGMGTVVSACLPIVSALATDPVEEVEAQDDAQAEQQITLLLGTQEVTDDAMIIAVQDAQADLAAAAQEIVQQTQLFDAATQKVAGDWAALAQALDNATQAQQEAEQDTADDPTFKLLQDSDALQWAADIRIAREWCFFAARALEYTLDASFAEEGECLQDETAAQIAGTTDAMNDDYDRNRLANGSYQTFEDQISMQQDVFGFTAPVVDPVTGQVLTPAQQFQAMLALPTNRDSAGNLQLQFATAIGGTLFSTDVGVDVIDTVEGNLVGSQLGGTTAYLTLAQSGHSRLLSYADGSIEIYDVQPKTATVPAGINLASPTDASTLPVPPSTDLFGRSVYDSGWTLTLDQQGTPVNKLVDLADIQDIVLYVTHRAVTIQGAP